MQVFGFSYEGYVLDTQVLFPHVFLNGVPNLSKTDGLYKECVNKMLEERIRLIILPSNEDEFYLLILDRFRRLLQDIGLTALKCKGKGEYLFYRQTVDLIRSKPYPTDFLVYWNAKKENFLEWLELDHKTIQKRERRLVLQIIEKYQELISNAEVIIKQWEDTQHEKNSCEFCEELKRLRDVEKTIPCEAHEEDLEIISDCLVYCNHFLKHGILYLITNDDVCYKVVKTIICFKDNQGNIVHIQGFDCKKPTEFLDQLKKAKSSKKSKTLL